MSSKQTQQGTDERLMRKFNAALSSAKSWGKLRAFPEAQERQLKLAFALADEIIASTKESPAAAETLQKIEDKLCLAYKATFRLAKKLDRQEPHHPIAIVERRLACMIVDKLESIQKGHVPGL